MKNCSSKTGEKRSRTAIISLTFAVAAIISVTLNFLFTFTNVYSMEKFFTITSILLSHAAFILGILSIIIIIFRRGELKGFWHATVAIFISLPFILAMLSGIYVGRVRAEGIKTAKGQRLSWAIIAYAKEHEGCLPDAGKWCDLLIEHDRNISKDSFSYPSSELGVCNYAFNKYLSGLRLLDIPPNIVLLFESEGPLNLAGTEELLNKAHKNRKYVYVLSRNGTIQTHNLRDIKNRDLRWKP
jgi:hypothetical protein